MSKLTLKKSSIAAKVPLIADLDYGELALNYTDGKLYFKNASNVIKSFTLDDATVTLTGTQTLTNKTLTSPIIDSGTINNAIIGGTTPAAITGSIVTSTGNLVSANSVGDEGGEILLAKPQTNSTLAGTGVTIDIWQNRLRFFEQGGSARGFYIDLTTGGAGVSTNLFSSGSGTVTSVSGTGTVSGLTLTGTITTSGSLTLGGTLAVTPANFASQTANTILAAPSGTAGTPTFRSLVATDIPNLDTSKITGDFLDGAFALGNSTDATKRAVFSLAGLATATTYTYSLPALSGAALATTGALTQSFSGGTTFSATFTLSGTTATISLGSSATSGVLTMGGTSGTGIITLGRSTVSQTTNIQAGATASGSVKTINLGTGGLTGSTTTMAIGSTFGTTVAANGTWTFGTAIAGSITGSAATLTTARTISLTGDVAYTSGSFNGSADVTGTATLAAVGTAGTYTKVTTDTKGRVTSGTTLAATDIPALDASKITTGTIDAARLPSYVDDVIEGTNLAAFPATGETGKIYVALDTNKTYRWSGSAYVYITSGAVDSVAGRTGVVVLTSSDVGLGSVENKSSATIRSELSSLNVTTALGFTPYNSTNPSGYTSNIGTVTSVNGTGTVSGLTLSGTVTGSGDLTLGGTLSLTSGQVTTALGYTPINKAGDTVTGNINFLDTLFTLQDDADPTKQARFQLSGNTTATTRTYTLPNIDGALATLGNPGLQTFTGNISFSGSVTLGGVTTAHNIGATHTSGTTIIGGTAQTGTITIGRSTVSQTTDIQAGAAASGSVKTINLGTGGLTGSTTTMAIGSTFGTTVAANGTWTFGTAIAGSITGTAANVTGTVAIANGGTGATTAAGALTALGAYAATNPSGYTTNTGTVTSVGGTGTVSGLTLSGTVTGSGNLTLGGTLSLTSGDVTTALNYTPVNKAGDTITGDLQISGFVGAAGFSGQHTGDGSNLTNLSAANIAGDFLDGGFAIKNSTDITKRAVFSLVGLTTATTRTYTLPNVDGTLATLGNPGAQTFAGSISINGSVTLGGTNTTHSIGTSHTSGVVTMGSTTGTGIITLGRSTVSQTTNIQAGATASGSTKTINLGTGGSTGSTTTIAIGSTIGTTVEANGIWTFSSGTANAVPYLNASKALTSGAALTFDGTNLGISGVASAVDFNSTSDRTKKTNIKTISGALDKVQQLRGVEFDWLSTGAPAMGLIAQEVADVIPQVVQGESGNMTLSYGNLVGLLIEAVKAQQQQIASLQQTVDKLMDT